MAGTQKKVRFKLAWQNYRVGDVITPSGTHRDWLVGNGYADVIDDIPAKIGTSGKIGKAAANLGRAVTRNLV